MNLDELQADIDDLDADSIADHLSNAESCDTIEDFRDNLQAAIDAAKTLTAQLKTMLAKASD
tara:strand:- start:1199 stop:1384 length:186 start_codon:yes stop_codon:yes gene_type:complete